MPINKTIRSTIHIIMADIRLFIPLLLIVSYYTSHWYGTFLAAYLFVLSIISWGLIKIIIILNLYIEKVTPYLRKWMDKDDEKKLWFDDFAKDLADSYAEDREGDSINKETEEE